MPITKLKDCIEYLSVQKRALGCFNIINFESLTGVLKGAEMKKSPVCLTMHPPHFQHLDMQMLVSSVRDAADCASVPVVLHLDNAQEIEQVLWAVKNGFSSVMYVGKEEISVEQKIKNTRLAAEIAHYAGLMIESDIPFDENEQKYLENILDFTQKTRIDIISANIISPPKVSGKHKPWIKEDLLKNIKEKTGKYVSLHGGSSLPGEALQKAISIGLDKMHIFGQMADLALQKMRAAGDADLIKLMHELSRSFEQVVNKNIDLFGSANTSSPILMQKKDSFMADHQEMVQAITKAIQQNLDLK